MSSLNKPGLNLLSSTEDDQIELDETAFERASELENEESRKRLIQQQSGFVDLDLDQTELSSSPEQHPKKNLIVRFEQLRGLEYFRTIFNRMSKHKNLSFLAILLLSILITYCFTKYSNNDNGASFNQCPKDKDLNMSDDETAKNVTKVYRLPTNVLPINYQIKIQPSMRSDELFFNGSVIILVNVLEVTNRIQLNANELEINSQQVSVSKVKNNEKFNITNFEYENEVLTLQLDRNLIVNESYTIYIAFKGYLTTSLSGFYRSSYIEPKSGEIKYLAMTQFQATDARRSFPCYDEPAFKATFEIEIIHWRNTTAISNMPVYSEENIDSDWMSSKFSRTVKMSTYLLSFAVGELEFKKDYSGQIRYRVATRPSEIESAEQAIKFTPKLLEHFEKYFRIKFPLPKLDMLAAPDFAAGAMENFGLITYREAYLLYDKKVASVVQLYRICSVIAHELAHQWFGNLVTPKWWDILWLNEGFATYLAYEGVNAVKPEWGAWDIFVLDEIQEVLNLDALKNSHSISLKEGVDDPSEISEIFDHISYSKSASIIRMLTYIIGIETFKDGLHNFLNAFSYSNANQTALWKYLQAATDKQNLIEKVNIEEIMNSWTMMEGYPLVTIARDYETNKVRFSQSRFLLNSNESDRELLMQTQYEVPLTYTYKSEQNWYPEIKTWLHRQDNKSESFVIKELPNMRKDDWLIANLRQIGYYRVTYDERNWDLLVNQLLTDHTKIDRISRAQLLDDLFHLAENGFVKYKLALKALTYFRNEKDSLPLTSIGQLTYLINQMLRRTEIFGEWQAFLRNLIEPAYKRFELNEIKDENLQDSQMQKTIVNMACGYNLVSCVQSSKRLFNKFMDNINKNLSIENHIPPNVRSAVYCTAIYHGDELEWDFIFSLYLKESNANERNAMLSALTCSRIPWILVRYLKWMFDESSGIKTQDSVFTFKSVAAQNYGKDIAFNFLRENWETIYGIHGKQMSFAHIVKSLDSINSEFELKLVKDFYRRIGDKVGSAKRTFLQTIEQIGSNVKWMQKYRNQIGEFLKENKQKNSN